MHARAHITQPFLPLGDVFLSSSYLYNTTPGRNNYYCVIRTAVRRDTVNIPPSTRRPRLTFAVTARRFANTIRRIGPARIYERRRRDRDGGNKPSSNSGSYTSATRSGVYEKPSQSAPRFAAQIRLATETSFSSSFNRPVLKYAFCARHAPRPADKYDTIVKPAREINDGQQLVPVSYTDYDESSETCTKKGPERTLSDE